MLCEEGKRHCFPLCFLRAYLLFTRYIALRWAKKSLQTQEALFARMLIVYIQV